jgi:hypothetical protein
LIGSSGSAIIVDGSITVGVNGKEVFRESSLGSVTDEFKDSVISVVVFVCSIEDSSVFVCSIEDSPVFVCSIEDSSVFVCSIEDSPVFVCSIEDALVFASQCSSAGRILKLFSYLSDFSKEVSNRFMESDKSVSLADD